MSQAFLAIESETIVSAIALGGLALQLPATGVLLSRLCKGPGRNPPATARSPVPDRVGAVSAIVPTLNEADRIGPCLHGLSRQSYELREVIFVDSRSTDGTPELVKAAGQSDPRLRLVTDDPLPVGWVGRPWALHAGFLASNPKSEWILGVDADVEPQPGMVAGAIAAAEALGYDLASFSPQFILKYPGEWWLQPALLVTLLYRFEPAGAAAVTGDRVMANGQCFLCRRSVLAAVGGYESAASSFCDDVTLARHIAKQGYKVGFLDGAQLLKVRMYEGALQTWQEWGRSLDLKDASTPSQVAGDLWVLACTQGLPLLLLALGLGARAAGFATPVLWAAIAVNSALVAIRFALLLAIAPSYDRLGASWPASLCFWLSPFADPLAVLRIFLSASQRPKQWRGRVYSR